MADHFGIDIGSESIKIVQLKKNGNLLEIVAVGVTANPVPNFVSVPGKEMVLAEAIKKLKGDAKVTTGRVVGSLPEKEVFTKILDLPSTNEKELEQMIVWEAESIIPYPLSEVNIDWEIIGPGKDKGSSRILLVAAPLELISRVSSVLNLAGLEIVALENEGISVVRALSEQLKDKNLVLLNIGASFASIILVYQGRFFHSRTIPSAGEAITRAVGTDLGLDFPVAEEYKRTYGLTEQFEGKIAKAIKPVLRLMVVEIRKEIGFFEENFKEPLRLLVLSGGTSLLPGLGEFLVAELGLEVQVATPFSFLGNNNDPRLQTLKVNGPLFTVAFGLARRGL